MPPQGGYTKVVPDTVDFALKRDLAQMKPGAKRVAGTRNHHGTDIGVVLRAVKCVQHLLHSANGQGIANLRQVDRENSDALSAT